MQPVLWEHMDISKLWCWELAAQAAGPDWLCRLIWAHSSSSELLKIIGQQQLPGFMLLNYQGACTLHQGICEYHTFIDGDNHSAFAQNVAGGEARNLWLYNTISLHQNVLEIEHGYGGREDNYARTETSFLLGLLAQPKLGLQHWGIYAGGQGYPWLALREGSNADELERYINASPN